MSVPWRVQYSRQCFKQFQAHNHQNRENVRYWGCSTHMSQQWLHIGNVSFTTEAVASWQMRWLLTPKAAASHRRAVASPQKHWLLVKGGGFTHRGVHGSLLPEALRLQSGSGRVLSGDSWSSASGAGLCLVEARAAPHLPLLNPDTKGEHI